MTVEQTPLLDCFVIHEKVYSDERGYFIETFNERIFSEKTGVNITFVQDNQSRSTRGVLRGLHMQKGEYAQAKLVRVLEGAVLDVVVDLRRNSPSFGKHFSIELTESNRKQLFVPSGFAHGFVVLSQVATFFYKVDNFYQPGEEFGIIYNDPELDIDWRIDQKDIILSEKDKKLGTLEEYRNKTL